MKPLILGVLVLASLPYPREGVQTRFLHWFLSYNVKQRARVPSMFLCLNVPSARHLTLRTRHNSSGSRFFLTLLLLALAPASCIAQRTGFDLKGKSTDPLTSNAGKVVVLIFVRQDCPISGRYAPTIQQISAQHQKDARFYLVFPDKSDSSSAIRKYTHDFRYSIPALHDSSHELVKLGHAHVTPEAAVFNAKGALVYHGRIDNLYESFGHARPAPTTHELEDAIEAALAGRPPSSAEAPSVGCYISDLE